MKEQWENEEYSERISKIISEKLKKSHKEGKYNVCLSQQMACIAAAKKNKGSGWYNNGISEFRLIINETNDSTFIRGRRAGLKSQRQGGRGKKV